MNCVFQNIFFVRLSDFKLFVSFNPRDSLQNLFEVQSVVSKLVLLH
jgi:hypothetical protein